MDAVAFACVGLLLQALVHPYLPRWSHVSHASAIAAAAITVAGAAHAVDETLYRSPVSMVNSAPARPTTGAGCSLTSTTTVARVAVGR